MTTLNPKQQEHAVEILREFLAAPKRPDGRMPADADRDLDQNRRSLIDQQLLPLVQSYLANKTPLDEFKLKIDGLNKRNEYWGFKGIKGQMFFNMLVNSATDPAEVDQQLKRAIAVPADDDAAKSRIRDFVLYAKRVGDEHVRGGGTAHQRPKIGSIPYFLSYFWQIQDRDKWPIYYTNGERTLEDLSFWHPSDDLGANYVAFKKLSEELAALFTKASGKPFHLYDVEHVLWFKGGSPYDVTTGTSSGTRVQAPRPAPIVAATQDRRLWESYVPPIVAILPQLSVNDSSLSESVGQTGTGIERVFEKNINAAFTILGYETQLLGQGQGRVPDGIAIALDSSYALIWDGKVRANGYSIGTDDRTIREYIQTQSRELKKRRSLRNIYYAIVSSHFEGDFDDVIRELKMETDVNEVCLMEAEALVAMVDQRLRDPLQIGLGPDGMQRLFSESGILKAAEVLELLT